LHQVGILFPHINDDARSKSHQIQMFTVIWWKTCRKVTTWKTLVLMGG